MSKDQQNGKPIAPSTILRIDRSAPFNPAKFRGLSKGWRIWCGPANGNGFNGDEDQDPRFLALTEIDFSQIKFITTLKEGESMVNGEETLRRLKETGHIRLDAKVFEAPLENKDLIPASLQDKWVHFSTVLRNPRGFRYILYRSWHGGKWHWYCHWLGLGWSARDSFAVLAK